MGVSAEDFNSRKQFALGGRERGKDNDQRTKGKLPNGKLAGDCNLLDREHPAGCHQLRFKSPQVYGTSNIAVRLVWSRCRSAGTFRIDAGFYSRDAAPEFLTSSPKSEQNQLLFGQCANTCPDHR